MTTSTDYIIYFFKNKQLDFVTILMYFKTKYMY